MIMVPHQRGTTPVSERISLFMRAKHAVAGVVQYQARLSRRSPAVQLLQEDTSARLATICPCRPAGETEARLYWQFIEMGVNRHYQIAGRVGGGNATVPVLLHLFLKAVLAEGHIWLQVGNVQHCMLSPTGRLTELLLCCWQHGQKDTMRSVA